MKMAVGDLPQFASLFKIYETMAMERRGWAPAEWHSLVAKAKPEDLFAAYEMRRCTDVYRKYLGATQGRWQEQVKTSLCLGGAVCPEEMAAWADCVRTFSGGPRCKARVEAAEACGRRISSRLFRALTAGSFKGSQPHAGGRWHND